MRIREISRAEEFLSKEGDPSPNQHHTARFTSLSEAQQGPGYAMEAWESTIERAGLVTTPLHQPCSGVSGNANRRAISLIDLTVTLSDAVRNMSDLAKT